MSMTTTTTTATFTGRVGDGRRRPEPRMERGERVNESDEKAEN